MAELCVQQMTRIHRQRLTRPMGPLETMYHIYHKRGMDIYAQIIHLLMERPVNQQQIRTALACLAKRHPLLRMTIRETNTGMSPSFKFVEMDPYIVDLREIQCDDFESVLSEELGNSLSLNIGPLWRFTVIHRQNDTRNFSGNLNHNFIFMFKCHHSVADGIYLHQLYSDFIEYLDLIQRGYDIIDQIQEMTFLPPIEEVLPLVFAPKIRNVGLENRNISCVQECNNNVIDALTAYNNCFSNEIECLSSNVSSTKVVRLNMTEQSTTSFLLSCKRHKVSVTGACITASCIAMAQLLKKSFSNKVDFINIPVEIMTNLRHYMTDKTFDSYPGVAAIHIPLNVRIPVNEDLEEEQIFWEIASKITKDVQHLIASGKPLQVMVEESQSCDQDTAVGKSPFVICFTNLSRVEDVLKDSLKDRFKIQNFPGITKVSVDDMPIFFIGAFTLNNQFQIGVEYCTSYTSGDTAATFSWSLRSKLQRFHRL